ncbi:porin [Rufibacter radiotolerans]|uniref:porin n=1 Tax=Rufibacter radiotolerans TaxID=1379910 RepID=UPI0012E31785|nr:porin [Rufibacter radiotolerans]
MPTTFTLATALSAFLVLGAAAGQETHAQTLPHGNAQPTDTLQTPKPATADTTRNTSHPRASEEHPVDTIQLKSVKELFSRGHLEGHVRNYFMATLNYRSLSDHYANGIGAEVAFKTASFHGFRMGITGLFTYNAFSSNLDHKDPISHKHPKLEMELFDVEDPGNRGDLDRLDALYLEYSSPKLRARIGRFSFTSPIMNPQDTRMKPYSFQGIHVQVPVFRKGQLDVAWLNHFSPRSTVEWFLAEESIGVFPVGVDEEGQPSGYSHHTITKGVAITGLSLPVGHHLKTEIWNYWLDNVANNTYGKAVATVLPKVKVGVEGLYQVQVGDGGNSDARYAYFQDQKQWLAGAMVGFTPEAWNLSVNYLHVGKGGRFLFPREWGREQFFATMPRGRIEGMGNSKLLVVKGKHHWSRTFSTEIAASRAWLPAPSDYRHNKYGSLEYYGWLADVNYTPAKPVLQGLSFRFLYVGRVSPGAAVPLKDYYYNSNFHNFNFVTQLTF